MTESVNEGFILTCTSYGHSRPLNDQAGISNRAGVIKFDKSLHHNLYIRRDCAYAKSRQIIEATCSVGYQDRKS